MLIIVVTIVVVITLITSLLLVIVFIPLRDVDIERRDSVELQEEVTSIDLDLIANVMTLNISYEEMQDHLIQFNLSITGGTSLLTSADVLEEYIFNQTVEEGTMSLTIVVKVEEAPLGISNLKVRGDLIVHSSLPSSIMARTNVGEIDLTSSGSTVISSISLETDVGKVKVHLGNEVALTGDIRLRTSTGPISLIWEDVRVMHQATVDIRTSIGPIDLEVRQEEPMLSDVDFNVRTSTGEIDFLISIETIPGARISSNAGVGEVDIERSTGFEWSSSSLLRSENYPTASDFIISLETGVGDIEIDAEYLP